MSNYLFSIKDAGDSNIQVSKETITSPASSLLLHKRCIISQQSQSGCLQESMERVVAEDHPLSSPNLTNNNLTSTNTNNNNNNNNSNTGHSDIFSSNSDSGRSPAASLIQSAARSILDDGTPSTAVSDDDSEGCRSAYGTLGSSRPPASLTLASLQMETMPALPDEQDRKRFVVSIFLCWFEFNGKQRRALALYFLISAILIFVSPF
jgi:hypothetical protein